ncbi:MAG: agmatinase [Erysipelotrichaceae bacterium]
MNQQPTVFIGCDTPYEQAKIVVFGAGFDGTTSYRPGTRFGPMAMRQESYGIETYSPYLNVDLEDALVFDAQDLDLPFGNTKRVLTRIEAMTKQIVMDEKIPCLLGGEHLLTLASVQAMLAKYPQLHIIHFDAHADLRDTYLDEPLSHACVMRRIHELVGNEKIHQFGIRSGTREEFDFAKSHTKMQRFDFTGLTACLAAIKDKPIYLSIDLDVLDPSCFPGTGTPEAGGVSFMELHAAIRQIGQYNVVGMDLMELAPGLDPSGSSSALACKILRELLLAVTIGGQYE